MRVEHDPLSHRVTADDIGSLEASFTFVVRLARENRRGLSHAEAVSGEYKRLCYLAVASGHEVTPSDAVDQVWHRHLAYSRDYWKTFCPEVLQVDLRHGPTRGRTTKRDRFYSQYAAILVAYEATFGALPPETIWPDAHKRLVAGPLGCVLTCRMVYFFHAGSLWRWV